MNKKGNLSQLDIFSIVLGTMIGWGSFMLPGTKFLKEAGVINTAIGLFGGALALIVIERSYRVMLKHNDHEGGEFSFTYNVMGKAHGFIVGWALLLAYLTMIPLNSTAFPLVIKKLFGNILEFGYIWTIAGYKVYLGEVLVSSIIVLLFASINISGIEDTSKTQNFIILALVSMATLVFVGMSLKGNKAQFNQTYIQNYSFDIRQIARVLAITPFLFVGFDTIPQVSQEFNFSTEKASRIAVIGLLLASLMYNILNIATAFAWTPEQAASLDWALGQGVLENLGKLGFVALVIALMAAVTSGINGFMLSTSKLMGAIAQFNLLPKSFAQLNEKNVYAATIKFATAISLIAPWFGREVILWIVDMASVGAGLAYLYVCMSAFIVTNNKKQRYVSFIGSLFSVTFILLLLIPGSPARLAKESIFALIAWIVLGFIFYMVRLKNSIQELKRVSD